MAKDGLKCERLTKRKKWAITSSIVPLKNSRSRTLNDTFKKLHFGKDLFFELSKLFSILVLLQYSLLQSAHSTPQKYEQSTRVTFSLIFTLKSFTAVLFKIRHLLLRNSGQLIQCAQKIVVVSFSLSFVKVTFSWILLNDNCGLFYAVLINDFTNFPDYFFYIYPFMKPQFFFFFFFKRDLIQKLFN